MYFMRRRRRLVETREAPASLPVRFSDERDNALPIGQAGAPRFVGANADALPRREFTNWEEIFGGMGRVSPMQATAIRRRRVGTASPRLSRFPLPLASQPVFSTWKAHRVIPVPHTARVCLMRSQRREVLHALGVAGRRGLTGRGGSYNRRPSSAWSCR